MQRSRIYLRVLALVTQFACTCAYAGALWFADSQGLHRVDTDTNLVTTHIAQPNVVTLALNQKDGSLWASNGTTLFKFDASGASRVTLDLKVIANNFNSAIRIALDPSDDGVWVAGGKNIARVDAAGQVVASATTPSNVRDIALAQDKSLWVLGANELTVFDAAGHATSSASLSGDLQQATAMLVDSSNASLWLAGAKTLWQFAPSLPLQQRFSRPIAEVVSAAALVADSGDIWVAGQSSVFRFDRAGAPQGTTDLSGSGISNLRVLQFEPQSHSMWLGHQQGLTRLGAAGNPTATLPASVAVNAISSAPSGIVPIVTLMTPPDGTITRDPLVPIRVHFDASCFGQPCNFPASVLGAYVLTATLNGRSIGGAFVFDPATRDATYTPVTPHDQGLNTFTAFVTDSEGRRSQQITSRFTVDSVAPRFLGVTPPDGTVFTSPGVTLQGSVDDSTARVLLESFSGAPFTGPNPAGPSFAFGITLQPGSNSFRLTATDPAGNATQLPLAFIFSTLTLNVTSPANGAVTDDNHIVVAGTFSGAATATITVNGIPAIVTGNAFTADVPLVSGANTITVVGVTPQGASATRTLTVTSTVPAIFIDSPANGAALTADRVLVRGRVQASDGSGVTVNGVIAIVNGGAFAANGVPLQLGANVLTALVTTRSGKTASATVNVSSDGPSPIYVTAEPLEGITPTTVAFTLTRVSVPVTSFSFDPGGSGSQAPTPPGALFAFTYPQAGTFSATVTLSDSSGNSYPKPFVIQVRTAADMDAMFRAIWNGMNNALVAGDKATAMTFLSSEAKDKYGPVFDKLLPQMPGIVASYSPLQRLALGPRIAEYAINRTLDGVNRIFIIAFVQDESGAWLIDQM